MESRQINILLVWDMKCCCALRIKLVLLAFFLSFNAFSQADQTSKVLRRPLLKIGGFIYPDSSRYGGFSFHLEFERTLRRKAYLTSGPRLDYINFEDFFDKNYFVGYEFKFYPMYWKTGKPYHGVFIGIEPLYLVQTNVNKYSRYGPGVGTLLGYQQMIRDKFSICIEPAMNYILDLNSNSPKYNNDGKFLYFLLSIKFGLKL